MVSAQVVYYSSSKKTKYHEIPSDFGVLPNYLPCAVMPHFYIWQQSKTCTPGIALIDKTKKSLLYAECYAAMFSPLGPRTNIIDRYLLLLYRCIKHTYFPLEGALKSFRCYKNMILHVLHVCSHALVVLLANCYV